MLKPTLTLKPRLKPRSEGNSKILTFNLGVNLCLEPGNKTKSKQKPMNARKPKALPVA